MGHPHGSQGPADAIVLGFDAEEVEQDVEILPAIRLRGGGVPVAILRMILGNALEHQPHPRRRMPHGQLARSDRVEQRRPVHFRIKLTLFQQTFQPGPHPTSQDAAERSRRHQVLRKQSAAVPLHKVPNHGIHVVIPHPLQHGETQLTGVRHPGFQQKRHQLRDSCENLLAAFLRRFPVGSSRLTDPFHE